MPFVKQKILLSLNAVVHIEIFDGKQGPLGKVKTPRCQ